MPTARAPSRAHMLCLAVVLTAASGCAREHAQVADPSSRPMGFWQGNQASREAGGSSLPSFTWYGSEPGEEAAWEELPAEALLEGPTLQDIVSTEASSSADVLLEPEPSRAVRPAPVLPQLRKLDASTIPDGEACLTRLMGLGVSFRLGPEKKGMKTSVLVEGPLGGVAYRGLHNAPLLCDCRLAVALSWVGPDFLSAGITEVFYSGAYSYRMSRIGRMSLHAWGLAIDIHEVTAGGKRLRLTHDYERGLADPCSSVRPLNQVACRLRARGMWREFITPDHDADHHDHFHISIKPHGEDPVVRRPQRNEPPVDVPGRSKRGKHKVVADGGTAGSEEATRSGTGVVASAKGQQASGSSSQAVANAVESRGAARKPADKPADKPAEKPADKPADKPAEKANEGKSPAAARPGPQPAEARKPADKPAEKPAEKPGDKPAEKANEGKSSEATKASPSAR